MIRSASLGFRPASELLRAGAVLEKGFNFETLMGMAGLGEAEGLSGLDELIERHLLREEGGGQEVGSLLYSTPTYSFTHQKIRQVAYTEMGHARRQLLHRRAFEVLEEELLLQSWRVMRLREVLLSRPSGTPWLRGIGRWMFAARTPSTTTKGRAPCWPK